MSHLEETGGALIVPLTKGYSAIIDASDAWILTRKWSVCARPGFPPYAIAGKGKQRVSMHQILAGERSVGLVVDHKNGNSLDNRRDNLRIVTATQNVRNTKNSRRNRSGVRGVSYNAKSRAWAAEIRADGKYKWLGVYKTIEEAARARAKAEVELWGIEPQRRSELERYL